MHELIRFTLEVFGFLSILGLGTCILIMLVLLIKIGWRFLQDI
jgi:hypothetical protein